MEFLEINITRAYNDKETDPSMALPKIKGRWQASVLTACVES